MQGPHTPSWKNTFDTGNLITLVVIIIGGVTAWNRLDNNQTSLQAAMADQGLAYKERQVSVEARFAGLETKIAPMDSIVYRLTKAEGEIASVNSRVDRIADSFGDRLEALRKDVNLLGTKVEVLTATIIDQNRRQSAGQKPGG